MPTAIISSTKTDFTLYTTPNGKVKLQVFLQDETLWLTQKMIAELFDVEVNTINYHLKEIFKSQELSENSTVRKFRIVQKEGSREVSRELADKKARTEYQEFNKVQPIVSDFDKAVKQLQAEIELK